jgi:hypothetical protein
VNAKLKTKVIVPHNRYPKTTFWKNPKYLHLPKLNEKNALPVESERMMQWLTNRSD